MDNNVYALNASTGSLIWSYTTGNYVRSSPAVADGILFVGSDDHKIYAFRSLHAVAMTNVAPSRTIVGQGYSVFINATVENNGDFTETFNVTAYADTTIIETKTNITITSGNSTTITFTWNTSGFVKGNYTLTANASILEGEAGTLDNTYVDGIVFVTVVGDVNGDHVVEIDDLLLIIYYWGTHEGGSNWNPNMELSNDTVIDIDDLLILIYYWGSHW